LAAATSSVAGLTLRRAAWRSRSPGRGDRVEAFWLQLLERVGRFAFAQPIPAARPARHCAQV